MKRKNKQLRGAFRMTAALLWVAVALVSTVDISHGTPSVVYKEPRDRKDLEKMGKKPAYRYDPTNKTDPFASYLMKREKILKELEERRTREMEALVQLKSLREAKTELQKLDLSQLTLTAIIKGDQKAWALVRDPKGMGYVLKKGTFIGANGGVVDRIVRETKRTPYGNEYTRKVIIKEPYLNKSGGIDYKRVEMEMAAPFYE